MKKDTPEKLAWARNEISRVLDNVSPEQAINLIREVSGHANTPSIVKAHAETTILDKYNGMAKVLESLLSTVEATGGIIEYQDGTYAPEGEPDWIDLGDVALKARDTLQIVHGHPVALTIKTSGE